MVAQNGQPDPRPGDSNPHRPSPQPDDQSAAQRSHPSELPPPRSEIEASPSDVPQVPGLPTLTAHGRAFLAAVVAHNYDLRAAARAINLSDETFVLFISHPGIHAHLEALFHAEHTATQATAAIARRKGIHALQQLADESDDPREQRIIHQTVIRATSAKIVPAGSMRTGPTHAAPSGDSSHPAQSLQDPRSEIQNPRSAAPQSEIQIPQSKIPPPRITPDYFKPAPADSAKKTFLHLLFALQHNNHYGREDNGLRVIAEFLEHNAQIDARPIPTQDPLDCLNALRLSSVAQLRGLRRAWNYAGEQISESREAHTATIIAGEQPIKVTMELTRAAPTDTTSRDPARWLISSITTAPEGKWPEGAALPIFLTSPFDTC